MTNPITAYDDGLEHDIFLYKADNGGQYYASIRSCYLDDGIVVQGNVPANAKVTLPKPIKMRHLILTSVDLKNGRALKRTVPCNKDDIQVWFSAPTPYVRQVDGENFTITGWHGETFRNPQAPT